MEHHAAAALAVDRQLLQEGHAGLHSLGAGEQGAEETERWPDSDKENWDFTVCEATGMSHIPAETTP